MKEVIEPISSSGLILPTPLIKLIDKDQVHAQNFDDDTKDEIHIGDFWDIDEE